MQMNKINRTSVGADYVHEHHTPDTRRGRFIVPTADLSAPVAPTQTVVVPDLLAPLHPYANRC